MQQLDRHGALRSEPGMLDAVARSAAEFLDELVGSFPLRDRAATSLGTALRVKEVRNFFQGRKVFETSQHLAAGTDAVRHLSPCSLGTGHDRGRPAVARFARAGCISFGRQRGGLGRLCRNKRARRHHVGSLFELRRQRRLRGGDTCAHSHAQSRAET